MSSRCILLLSGSAGAGRTTLAANLAALLARDSGAVLVETRPAQQSEISLHLGEAPGAGLAPTDRAGQPYHLCSSPEQLSVTLSSLEGHTGWVLVDGASLDQQDWLAMAAACGRVLVVEKADLQGCRRLPRTLSALQGAGLPNAATAVAWMGAQASQPLPPMPGMPAVELPWDPKACERLSQARLWSRDEPRSLFAQRCQALLQVLAGLQPAILEAASSANDHTQSRSVPKISAPEEGLVRQLSLQLRKAMEGERSVDDKSAMTAALRLLAAEDAPGLSSEGRQRLARRLVQDLLGLGPLEDLLADPEITEIMVNQPDQVYVERQGRLSLTGAQFQDEHQLRTVIERIVWPLGRRIDESSPKVDARLPDGSRVNAVIPPLAVHGSCLTIRKFPARRLGMAELVARGSLDERAASFLRAAVEHKQNILVSGGTGSGKTTLLNALSSFIPEGERIITIEDAAELRLQQPHVVTLESRPANLEGQGAVSIRDLVSNALRMRPDRIVVGECRGGEALDMLQAMNTGHEGSLSTIHANSPRDALQRLETLCLMAGLDLPLRVVRQQVASAIDLVVQVGRQRDGSRKVLAITELSGTEGEVISLQDLFVWEPGTKALGATGLPGKLARELRQVQS